MKGESIDMKEIDDKLFGSDKPIRKEWEVKDIGSADWALSVVKSTEKNYQERINYLDSVVDKAKKMKKELEEKIETENSFLINKLKDWTKESIKNQKSKTINLLNGSLSFRKTPASVEIVSDQQVFKFCDDKNLEVKVVIEIEMKQDEVPELIKSLNKFDCCDSAKIKQSVIKKEIIDYFKSKGVDSADFPGGHYSSGEERFYIK